MIILTTSHVPGRGIKDFDSEADGQEEGGLDAGINNRDGNGSIGHAGWRL